MLHSKRRYCPSSTVPVSGSWNERRAVVLIGVMVAVAFMSYFAYQYSELTGAEAQATKTTAKLIQARLNAESGVAYIMALLSSPDNITNVAGSNLFDNAIFQGKGVKVSADAIEPGRFSIVSLLDPSSAKENSTGYRFGLWDENSKINLNALVAMDKDGKIAHDVLIKLPNMTEELVDAIIDWIDSNETARPAGCESDYYLGLSPGYKCKNAPLDSLDELLLVRGVTPLLLFGNDKNRNGILDPSEATEDASGVDLGWSAFLTVFSREQNVAKDATPRININDADLETLFNTLIETEGITEELASYIALLRLNGPYKAPTETMTLLIDSGGSLTGEVLISARSIAGVTDVAFSADGMTFVAAQGTTTPSAPSNAKQATKSAVDTKGQAKNNINSLFDLVNSYIEIKPASGKGQSTFYASPLNDPATAKELLPILFEKTTTSKNVELSGRINVNSAPEAVLKTLPELTEEDVQKILDTRPDPTAMTEVYETPAWLLTEAEIKAETLSKIDKYITTRSEVYRVQVLGYFDGGGPSARLEAVIDINGGKPRIVHWRDLTELGRAIDVGVQEQPK